jgi:hypothetical protein
VTLPPRWRRGLTFLGTIVALVTLSVSCAATTYDTSISSQTAAPTTTVVPVGTASELLPQLVDEAAGLSKVITDEGDKLAVVERMEALWSAVRTEVTTVDRDIAVEIEAEIGKGRAAATFNRPGSADKVYRNLNALVHAYLELA